jgi:hypothetical protein
LEPAGAYGWAVNEKHLRLIRYNSIVYQVSNSKFSQDHCHQVSAERTQTMRSKKMPDRPRTTASGLNRRQLLGKTLAVAGSAGIFLPRMTTRAHEAAQSADRKKVAAVVTIYRRNSHADVLVGKILEGWKQDGGTGPALELTSLYVDQFPADDLSVGLAAKYGFRVCKSIRECIELDSGTVAVDGVLSIGEHGNYPVNELGQQLYPRKRFFAEICDVLEQRGKIIPVFNDKHPGPVWQDAQWMMHRAEKLGIPWMAGSSLTVGFRDPDVTLPLGEPVASCLAVGYSGLDIYGFHTLDFLQAIVERRATKSQGVRSVQALPLSALDEFINQRTINEQLLGETLRSSGTSLAKLRENIPSANPKQTAIFVLKYSDGLSGVVLMLGSFASAISAGCLTQAGKSIVTRAEERVEPRYPHFAYLLKAIEKMIHTGKPSYAVERTMLAAGVLDRALNSLHRNSVELQTPELSFNYNCVDYPHAPHVALVEG